MTESLQHAKEWLRALGASHSCKYDVPDTVLVVMGGLFEYLSNLEDELAELRKQAVVTDVMTVGRSRFKEADVRRTMTFVAKELPCGLEGYTPGLGACINRPIRNAETMCAPCAAYIILYCVAEQLAGRVPFEQVDGCGPPARPSDPGKEKT